MSQARRALPSNFAGCLRRNAGSQSGPLRLKNILTCGPRRVRENILTYGTPRRNFKFRWESQTKHAFLKNFADVSAETLTFHMCDGCLKRNVRRPPHLTDVSGETLVRHNLHVFLQRDPHRRHCPAGKNILIWWSAPRPPSNSSMRAR